MTLVTASFGLVSVAATNFSLKNMSYVLLTGAAIHCKHHREQLQTGRKFKTRRMVGEFTCGSGGEESGGEGTGRDGRGEHREGEGVVSSVGISSGGNLKYVFFSCALP